MKKTMRFLAMMFVAATVLFAACGKDPVEPEPQPDPQPDPQPQPTMQLPGTSWETNFSNTYTYMGFDMNITAHMVMDFNNATEGEMFTDFTLEMPAYPAMNQTQDTTEAFNYTFDGTTLTLTSTDPDAEEGDQGTMTYNPEDTTFIMIIPDETYEGISIRDLYGSDRMIFHTVR